jgi:L-ascorbate metabolism protein UlaG (beta-lactamase superfamily)
MTLTRPGEYEFADLLVTGVRTWHDEAEGKERGENVIFTVEVDGVHVCHLGDLGHLLTDEQMHEIGPIDVLLVPAGGNTTLSPADAVKVVAQLEPKVVIPMHFAVDGGSKDLLGPETFFHELASEPIRLPKASLTPSTLPEESQVVLLEARGRSSSTAGSAAAKNAD